MKYSIIALVIVALLSLGCSEGDVNWATYHPPNEVPTVSVCSPEELAPESRTCIPEDKATDYLDIWKREFMARNGVDEDYFNAHISSLSTWSLCWRSGITFRVRYRVTVDWAMIDREDKIVVMLYSTENAYQYLNIPRDVFLDEFQIGRVLDNRVFDSAVGPFEPLEHLPYETCEQAIEAFQDTTGYPQMQPTRIHYYVPGKNPREDGYPYFIGHGEIDYEANECVVGYFNLFTGESEARLTYCWIE